MVGHCKYFNVPLFGEPQVAVIVEFGRDSHLRQAAFDFLHSRDIRIPIDSLIEGTLVPKARVTLIPPKPLASFSPTDAAALLNALFRHMGVTEKAELVYRSRILGARAA
jgi:hypothetical protein